MHDHCLIVLINWKFLARLLIYLASHVNEAFDFFSGQAVM